ncbi:Hemoglobin subunit beta-B [Heracleum sosnowskyi]|uniref:Hemoglobin subunit beta-B n=1 Tax=Heracleum sosnowskyi TaxID=360622 RepID=A0AAD8GNU6_9APIA|nr:Hemoglobin subunit beta-B [Heracleum sosnowskyi]
MAASSTLLIPLSSFCFPSEEIAREEKRKEETKFRKKHIRSVDVIAIRQQLLAQYDVLQTRIKELKEASENEVWMLARMCQLENKIFAVGEPSYSARRTRVKRVREGLKSSLRSRIELIESYAKISSMIEIEVEMDTDVLAAEAASNAESIAQQIEQIMELENLEEACSQ